MRPIFQWNLGSRVLELGRRTLIMGIVNVTPDSFSDGGLYLDPEKAVARAEQLLDEGADIIDIGGESTRPGASPGVSEEEELSRVSPVIRELKRRRPSAVISVDTYKASVARAVVDLGAEIVNDVGGFRWDPKMPKTVAELKVGAVLMHSRGRPQEWRSLPSIGDPVLVVKRDLRQWVESAMLAGIKRDHLVLDAGFGFGKRLAENYPLLAHFAELQQIGFPLLAGVSRKSFIGRMLARSLNHPAVNQTSANNKNEEKNKNGSIQNEPSDLSQDPEISDRVYGTLAAETALILKGAHILRTHEVILAREAARVADIIVASGG